MSTDSYDVVIIGSGAGGGTLARHLASSGKRILLLERGDWLTREPENWLAQAVFVENRYVSPETWYDAKGKPFQPQVHYFVGARQSSTAPRSTAFAVRTSASFATTTESRPRGRSPTTTSSRTTRKRSSCTRCTAPGVRTRRSLRRARPISTRPSRTSRGSRSSRTTSQPRATTRSTHRAGSCSTRRTPPTRGACAAPTATASPASSAKSDAEVIAVRPALEHPNVTLLRNARAVRLETNAAGTEVAGVVVEREGETETFAGDLVVVSCGAVNSARLLLESATDKHPNGLANRSDQVGRNFMFHDSTAVLALSREENPTVYQKTLGLNDFYFGADDFDYPLGNVRMVGKSQAPMFRGEKPVETKLAPQWSLERIARHAIDFWLSTEDLPRPENRVTVDRDGKVTLSYAETNAEARKRLYEKVKSIVGHLDMNPGHLVRRFAYLKNEIPVAGCAHQAGTCRFGTDPADSVLDTDCRAHELDNLYVVDTSFFPSIGAVNPALTAMANALRVGDHLLGRMA